MNTGRLKGSFHALAQGLGASYDIEPNKRLSVKWDVLQKKGLASNSRRKKEEDEGKRRRGSQIDFSVSGLSPGKTKRRKR